MLINVLLANSVVPDEARVRGGSVATVSKVGIGIIGTGTIAQSHLQSLQGHERARVVSVYDVLSDRAKTTAEQFGISHVASSLEELLGRDDVDAVIVCTPPFAHAGPTIAALEVGKHVLCEKPFALDPSEAERMVQTAERMGKFLACASGRQRLSPGQQQAHAMLERGELGDVYHVRSSSFRFRGRPGHHIFRQSAWFLDKERAGGGVMMDIAVYTIDSVLWLLGNPKVLSVTAQMRRFTEEPPADVKQDVEDHVVIMMQCEGGKSAIVESSWVANMRQADALLVFGTKAGLRLDPLTKVTARRLEPAERQPLPFLGEDVYRAVEEQVFPFPEAASRGQFNLGGITRSFVDGIVEGRQPHTPGRDALEVTKVIDGAYRSVQLQRSVSLE